MIQVISNKPVGAIGLRAGHKPSPVWADTKMCFENLKGSERLAIVSDVDWLGNAVKAFGWLMPGEVKVFESDDVRTAKQWAVGLDDD